MAARQRTPEQLVIIRACDCFHWLCQGMNANGPQPECTCGFCFEKEMCKHDRILDDCLPCHIARNYSDSGGF